MPLIQELELDLLEILDSLRCPCGGEKSKHLVLCYPCYRRLPLTLRKGLAFAVSKSLGEAYREAEQWLLIPSGGSREWQSLMCAISMQLNGLTTVSRKCLDVRRGTGESITHE